MQGCQSACEAETDPNCTQSTALLPPFATKEAYPPALVEPNRSVNSCRAGKFLHDRLVVQFAAVVGHAGVGVVGFPVASQCASMAETPQPSQLSMAVVAVLLTC